MNLQFAVFAGCIFMQLSLAIASKNDKGITYSQYLVELPCNKEGKNGQKTVLRVLFNLLRYRRILCSPNCDLLVMPKCKVDRKWLKSSW